MNLEDNGIDSMRKALSALFGISNIEDNIPSEFMLKDVVLNFHHSLEALFKHLISLKNKYLIFDNQEEIFKYQVTERKDNRYKTKNSSGKKEIEIKTIKYTDSLNRVIVLYDLEIDTYVYSQFIKLNRLRNALTHHESELKIIEIELLISCILPYITEVFSKYINGFKGYIENSDIRDELFKLYTKRDIWRLNLIFRALENKPSSSEFSAIKRESWEVEMKLLGYDSWNHINEDYFIKNQIEELIFSISSEQFLLDIQENDALMKWIVIEKKAEFVNIICEVISEKIKISLSHVLSEQCINLDAINDLSFIKPTFKSYKLLTKVIIADTMRVINKMRLKLMNLKLESEIFNNKIKYCFKTPVSSPTDLKITQIEFTFNEYNKICNKVLAENSWLFNNDGEESEFIKLEQEIDSFGYEEVYEKINDEVSFGDISSTLISESIMGDIGTIDRLEESESWLRYVIKESSEEGTKDLFIITLTSVSTETYVDHEYFYSGPLDIYVGARLVIDNKANKPTLSNISFIGLCDERLFV